MRPYSVALVGAFELASALTTLTICGLAMAVMDGRGSSDLTRCAVHAGLMPLLGLLGLLGGVVLVLAIPLLLLLLPLACGSAPGAWSARGQAAMAPETHPAPSTHPIPHPTHAGRLWVPSCCPSSSWPSSATWAVPG